MVLLTREATNRSRDGFRLFYFYKSRYGLRYFSALPYSLDIEPPDARGASSSYTNKVVKFWSVGKDFDNHSTDIVLGKLNIALEMFLTYKLFNF